MQSKSITPMTTNQVIQNVHHLESSDKDVNEDGKAENINIPPSHNSPIHNQLDSIIERDSGEKRKKMSDSVFQKKSITPPQQLFQNTNVIQQNPESSIKMMDKAINELLNGNKQKRISNLQKAIHNQKPVQSRNLTP